MMRRIWMHKLGQRLAIVMLAGAAILVTTGAGGALAAGGYGPPAPGPPKVPGGHCVVVTSQTITPAGGTIGPVTIDGASVTLIVPAGAFPVPVQITLTAPNLCAISTAGFRWLQGRGRRGHPGPGKRLDVPRNLPQAAHPRHVVAVDHRIEHPRGVERHRLRDRPGHHGPLGRAKGQLRHRSGLRCPDASLRGNDSRFRGLPAPSPASRCWARESSPRWCCCSGPAGSNSPAVAVPTIQPAGASRT